MYKFPHEIKIKFPGETFFTILYISALKILSHREDLTVKEAHAFYTLFLPLALRDTLLLQQPVSCC